MADQLVVRADLAEAAHLLEANGCAQAVVVGDAVITAALDVASRQIHRGDGAVLINASTTAKEEITQPIHQLGVDLLGDHLAGAIDDRVEPAFEQVLHIEERVLQRNGRFGVAVGADLGEVIGDQGVANPETSSGELGADARIHGVVVALIGLDAS